MEIKVLLVEDEKDIRELITQKLQNQGFTVYSTDRGDKVLEVMGSNKADIILLDQIMPGKNGNRCIK